MTFDLKEIRNKFEQKPKRRNIFYSQASIFDPLGLLILLCIGVKTFLQGVYRLEISWDEILPYEYCFRWQTLLNLFNELNELAYPRKHCFNNANNPFARVELHSFSNASKRIYVIVIYLRLVSKSGLIIETFFVTSKEKVLSCASTKTILWAELNIFYFLTDSSIVLCWINNIKTVHKP